MLGGYRTQRGVTLIELMIASVLSLIAASAALTVYSATARHSTQMLRNADLHQQLHALLHLISRDLKRAGYWRFDVEKESPTDNPFQNADNRLRIRSFPEEMENSCILFSYDLDQDGLLGIGQCKAAVCAQYTDNDNVEQFGYRLRNAQVQSRYGGAQFNCLNGNWQALTDRNIEITHLAFIPHRRCLNLQDAGEECSQGHPALLQQAVEVQLRGRLRTAGSPETLLSQWIQIRNHRLTEAIQQW